MTMDNTEIVNSYRAAKDPKKQIITLSELNLCGIEKIVDILTEAGEKVVGQRMSPKDYLSRARHLDREITALLRAKQEARSKALSATRAPDSVNANATPDPHGRFDRLVELEELIDRRVDALVDVKREILTAIAQVEDSRYRTLLTERYVNFLTWEEIAVEMHYSFRRVTQLHGEALRALLPIISHGVCDRV